MKATQGSVGRVFVLQLEDGDVVPECIERFASEQCLRVGQVLLLGAFNEGTVVAGPRDSNTVPRNPILLPVDGIHETIGVGLIAPDETGAPRLHMHGALGRSGATLTGCLREGVTTWLIAEAVITELLAGPISRLPDAASGISLLTVHAAGRA
ncbi:MAG: DNA-binding protein [Dehalococcoidia bacterium]|nr:DNA-binding protein [Dehalococcoidia bacterium]